MTKFCEVHSFQGIGNEQCPWCERMGLEAAARKVAENFSLYGSQINVIVPMDLIERLQRALADKDSDDA